MCEQRENTQNGIKTILSAFSLCPCNALYGRFQYFLIRPWHTSLPFCLELASFLDLLLNNTGMAWLQYLFYRGGGEGLTAEIDRVRPAYERTWPVDPLVSAKMIDQAIVVRVPVLMSRFAGARKNAVHNRWYSHFFAESVYTVVRNLNVNPEMFADGKCLSFVSVYERNHNIPDADNLDSKAIVDAIVSSLPGGDRWATTTFFRMNTTSNGRLDEATYVAVTPGLSPPPVPDLLEIVRKENQYEH